MPWNSEHRRARLAGNAASDQRDAFTRDRDRILYSSAFRRLAGVTQIVRAGEEDIFHDRLIHSIKVSQVGRRLAEKLVEEGCGKSWIDPDVVEAACLAHDLGHPPFGHCGEKKLDQLMREPAEVRDGLRLGVPDDSGFEGNAQSFRILTKLSVRWGDSKGLDLARATLAACLKYPWTSSDAQAIKGKWGAYESERAEFEWCLNGWPGAGRTLEAQIMDWADDITYSVHDLEDFHRCGVIPWRELFGAVDEGPISGLSYLAKKLIDEARKKWELEPDCPDNIEKRLLAARETISERLALVPNLRDEIYKGTRLQRQQVRQFNSSLVSLFVSGTNLKFSQLADGISLSSAVFLSGGGPHPEMEFEADAPDIVRLLKAVAVTYIISSPALQAQQYGQGRIIGDLFTHLTSAILNGEGAANWIPVRFHSIVDEFRDGLVTARRAASDCICSMTESEAIALRNRILGVDGGSVFHPVVR